MKKAIVCLVMLAAGPAWAGPKGPAARSPTPSPEQVSSFYEAIQAKDGGRIAMLVESGFPLNSTFKVGFDEEERDVTPVSLATESGDFSIVDYLVRKGATVPPDFLDPLLRSSISGRWGEAILNSRIISYRQHGMQIPDDALLKGFVGVTEIYLKPSTVELLIKLGADPNAVRRGKNSDGSPYVLGPPIWHCFLNLPAMRVLIKHGANVNVRADDGRSLLTVAREWKSGSKEQKEMLDLLVQAGAKE